ncbi:MAG: tryptophan synthase subunit alpha [Candidatus Hadarchaeales archaeon]
MGKIGEKFDEARNEGRVALIPFIMVGDPSPESTVRIAKELARAGADMIELGLCFSDPIADGPTIQAASQRALAAGVTPKVYFNVAEDIRAAVSVPLIALTYYNPVLRMGASRFLRRCVKSGINGIIVPDLSIDEGSHLLRVARRYSVDTIFLAAPTSTHPRLKGIVEASTGFVYLVSVLGVTGARRQISDSIGSLVKRIKKIKGNIPVAVGFGVSSPSQVRKIGRIGADGAIVGSALIDIISRESGDEERMLGKLSCFLKALRYATKV